MRGEDDMPVISAWYLCADHL